MRFVSAKKGGVNTKVPLINQNTEILSLDSKALDSLLNQGASLKRRLPTLPLLRSTIGVTRLNFSVRNGKRWNPRAITT